MTGPGAPRFVVVGNGVAGFEAALLLRERSPDASIAIVSEESDHHFSRTALMWIHAGQLAHRDTEPFERDAYARHRFDRIRARAIGVDTAGRRVLFAGDRAPLPYDRLLLASGSCARAPSWPGADLVGVGRFVTHQDLAWLEEELHGSANPLPPPNARAHLAATTADSPYAFRPSAASTRGRASRAPAIVGGGLIGLEVVDLAIARGLASRFFIRDEWFWPMALDANESAFVERRLAAHGVTTIRNTRIDAFVGDDAGRVSGVVDRGTTHPADCVVVAIGVRPNTDWLDGSAIERDASHGIVVDASLRTNDPSVFAAGDCASVIGDDGIGRPEQLWYTARDQGRVAARAMLGDDVRYTRGIAYNSAKLADVEYTTVGSVDARPGRSSWWFEERGRVTSTTRIVLEGDRVVGFNLLGRRWDHSVLIEFLREERRLPDVLDRLHEAAFDTEFVPPLRFPRTLHVEGP